MNKTVHELVPFIVIILLIILLLISTNEVHQNCISYSQAVCDCCERYSGLYIGNQSLNCKAQLGVK